MNRFLKKVPKTDKNNYISGFESLNIVSKTGVMRDWHPQSYLTISNDDEYIELYHGNDILGDYGIECRDIPYLNAKNVYIANHFRAYIDYILKVNALTEKEREVALKEILYATKDFFDNDDECKELYRLLKLVKPILDEKIFKTLIYKDFAKYYLAEIK